MAITYPLNIPTVGVQSIAWNNRTASLISRSPFTFQGQAQTYPGQIRSAQITVENSNRVDAEEWIGFLLALNGCGGTFLMGDPLGVTPRGVGRGTATVRGANQSGSTLTITGSPTAVTNGYLLPGDWIQLGTGLTSRLHKVTRPANLNATGQSSLEIWPALRFTPANGAAIRLENTVGLFRLSTGEFSYTERGGCKFDLAFACEEVV